MSEPIRLPWWVRTERQVERHLARRHSHRLPWSSCNTHMRGFCVRCAWRDMTGQTNRARRAYVAQVARMSTRTATPDVDDRA